MHLLREHGYYDYYLEAPSHSVLDKAFPTPTPLKSLCMSVQLVRVRASMHKCFRLGYTESETG